MITLAKRADGGSVTLDGDNIVTVRPLRPNADVLALPNPEHKKLSRTQKTAAQALLLAEEVAQQKAEIERLNFLLKNVKTEHDSDMRFYTDFIAEQRKQLRILCGADTAIQKSLPDLRFAHSNLRAGNIDVAMQHLNKVRSNLDS